MTTALRWDDLQLFLAVAETGSLSAAARRLHLGQPTLSRRVAELEDQVGERLFERTAQGVRLTATAQRLLPSVQRMAEFAADAQVSLPRRGRQVQGWVRVAAPPGVAFEVLAPLAAQLRHSHPGLRLEVQAGVETLSLVRGEADLSLRTQPPTDDDLLVLDELSLPVRAWATPEYARRLPPQPSLGQVDWIVWSAPYEGLPSNVALAAAIPGLQPVFAANDWLVQLAACKAGVGALLMVDAPHQHAETRHLQALPVELGPAATAALYLVAHKRQHAVRRVQPVVDALRQLFRQVRG